MAYPGIWVNEDGKTLIGYDSTVGPTDEKYILVDSQSSGKVAEWLDTVNAGKAVSRYKLQRLSIGPISPRYLWEDGQLEGLHTNPVEKSDIDSTIKFLDARISALEGHLE